MTSETIRLGHLAIDAEPLPLTLRNLRIVAEAMAELGLDGDPPALWHVEMSDVADLAAAAAVKGEEPLGVYMHAVDEEPLIVVQRGLPAFVERAIIRHELAHWAQDRAGRFEIFDPGRWWVSAEASRAGDEEEARRFGCDVHYWTDRILAGLVPPPGYSVRLERVGAGRLEWRGTRQRPDGRLEELVYNPAPSASAGAAMRELADVFLAQARGDPSIVDRLNAGASLVPVTEPRTGSH